MSCGPCEEKKRNKKDMTRGEFLGVGAVAAAGIGAVGMGAAAPQEVCAKSPDCKLNPTARPERWAVTASILQVIWGDLVPRFAAYKWRNGNHLPGFGIGVIDPAGLTRAIHHLLGELSTVGIGRAPCTQDPLSAEWTCDLVTPTCLTPFESRVKLVLDYLAGPVGGHIPIRLLAEGGFDFILSDAGLDLFVPDLAEIPPPPWAPAEDLRARRELLRFFEYRRSGRSTIGIPEYLDDSWDLAFDVQSPTGPSQVWTDAAMGFAATPINPWGHCTLADLSCLAVVDRPPLERSETLRREVDWRPQKGFTVSAFAAAVKETRCWQLEGSVYRGILTELPRVVAAMWEEQLTGCSTGAFTYTGRWGAGAMRTIFAERLESSLPGVGDMIFDAGPGPDVTITNKGILFPHPGPPPALADMLDGIVEGKAGNPVFTDTRRPPRDE